MRVRIRKEYSKEKFLNELDKEDWVFKNTKEGERVINIEIIDHNIRKLTKNLKKALSSIAPIKIIILEKNLNHGYKIKK